jgi:ferredoxin-like protein FixX
MCFAQNRRLQRVCNVSWSKLSVSACLECVAFKIVSYNVSGMCLGQLRLSYSACLECVALKIISYSMYALCHAQNC